MPIPEKQITEHTRRLLARPTAGQVRFSDVYPEVAGLDQEQWWRYTDFDAALTDRVESGGFAGTQQIPIGLRPWMAQYGLLLVDDLVKARNERLGAFEWPNERHPDLNKEGAETDGAVVVLANKAHRNSANVANGQNGSHFLLAISESGTEYYATPSSFLRDLDAQDRITALYEIPNENHPEFNGDHEQFRSARVTRTRRHPDHLVKIFDYEGDADALRQAREDGTHPGEAVPADERPGRIAHVDKFGNVVLWLDDASAAAASRIGETAVLALNGPSLGGEQITLEVKVTESLKDSPADELVVYGNCSTPENRACSGLVELMVRVDDDPNTSEMTAFPQLLKAIRDVTQASSLDIATTAVTLEKPE